MYLDPDSANACVIGGRLVQSKVSMGGLGSGGTVPAVEWGGSGQPMQTRPLKITMPPMIGEPKPGFLVLDLAAPLRHAVIRNGVLGDAATPRTGAN